MSRRVRAVRAHLGPALVGAMLGALVAGRIETALLCLLVATGAAIAASATVPTRRWRIMMATGAALGWALNLYLTPGRPLAGPWPVLAGRHATEAGLDLGLLLTLRFAGACVALLGLKAAWPGERAADSAARWLAPLQRLGVPVSEARAVLGLSLRFAPLLGAEAARIGRVQALRAGRPPRGARERLERLRAGTVPAMVGALERAERVALALESRHHRLRPAGASLGRPGAASQGSGADRVSLALGAALAALAIFWRG